MAEHLNNEDLDSLSSNDLSSSEMLISPTVTLRTASVPKIYKEENVLPSDRRCSSKLRILVILLVVLSTVMAICLVVVIMRCRKSSFNKQKRSVENVKRFFQLSDTHFDLYYDANLTNKHSSFCRDKPLIGANSTTPADTSAMYGRVKCDSPITLLHSLAEELQNVNNELEESVHFVLITGDQSAHAYSNFQLNATEATIWSIGNSTKVIGEALKDVPIFPLLGNNDLLLDYDPPIVNHSYLYQTLRNIWEPYIFRANVDQFNTRKDFQQTFEYGGYYKVDTDGHLVIIMMNSNYWSSEAFKLNPIVTTIGDAQLKWLETQLNHAKQKKQKVILAGHIPPGCSTYPGDRNMWLQNYTEAYINLTTTLYPDVVTAQLYGHTHSDKIKLQKGQSTKEAFLLICPSLTPNYQNNPAFRLFEYESEQQRLHDYTQFYFDLTVANVYRKSYWLKEYSFREEYQKTLSVDDVKSLVEDLSSASSPTWFKYSTHIKSQYNSVLFTQRFVEYCGAKNADYVSFVRCLKNYKNIGI